MDTAANTTAGREQRFAPVIDWKDVTDVELDGIDMKDYPKFCDAFVCGAYNVTADRPCTDEEIEVLNEDTCEVYERVVAHVF